MAYVRTTWTTGDVITASLANNWEGQFAAARSEFTAGNWPNWAGTEAARPAHGITGRVYIATDTRRIWRDTGTAWAEVVTPAGIGATPIAHESATAAHSATPAPTADRSILRDAAGRAQVAAPSAAADIARLDTVTGYAVNRAGDTMTGLLRTATTIRQIEGTGGSGTLEIMGSTTLPAAMSFHRPSAYAINFGLDLDNHLKVGGWSLGAVKHRIWHEGNDGIGSGLDADLVRGQAPRIGGQVEYNTPGSHSWTVPTGIFNVVVEIFSATGGGAGGNGGSGGTGGSWGNSGFSGGGSGAGRYVRANVPVIAGQNIEIVIGVAGSAGVGGAGGPAGAAGSPGTAGGSGGQTSFGAGIPVIAIICPGSAGGSVTAGGAAAAATLLSHPTWAISPGANGTAFTGAGINNGGAGGAGAGVAGGAGGVGQPNGGNPGSNGGNGSQGNAIWHTGSGGGAGGSGGDFNAPGGAGGNGAPGLSGRIIISW